VNLAHLRHNLRVLERAMSDALRGHEGTAKGRRGHGVATPAKRAAIWGVLKADGYGHGASAVARTLERAGIAGLCVALLEEAIELRAAGIRIPILVMGGYYGPRREGFHEILAHDLVPVVYNAGHIERFASVARFEGSGRRIRAHLKVDTGMGRLGASAADLKGIFDALKSRPEVSLDGLMTHLACADAESLEPTFEQLRRFRDIEARVHAEGHVPRVLHAANSAAMLRLADSCFDVVRPGIALFGVAPCAGLAADLRPVMRVRSEIVAVRTIEAGEAIGYGHTWRAARESLIATVPMGYADGLDRQLSNRGHALVRGRRVPIVGAVSMDLTMIDVTDIPGAQLGDEAVFLGSQEGPLGRDSLSAVEIAEQTGTVPWEVLTSISRRVPRFYREP
jgi:alanine racemase